MHRAGDGSSRVRMEAGYREAGSGSAIKVGEMRSNALPTLASSWKIIMRIQTPKRTLGPAR